MESILSSLDTQIQYLSHEFMADQVVFKAKTCFVTAICPYCGVEANKVHSKYRRVFQDIPISTFETVIHLELPKFFCSNIHCPYATFSVPISFIEPKARKTKRLEKNFDLVNVSFIDSP